jgi:serine/threonine protein kinase
MGTAEPGRLLAGRYRFRGIIGRGGMGAVWRARDELLSRDVAVKEIIWPPQMEAAERETARRRTLREAQMAARLNHPNVVKVYDIVEEDGRPWIVMELVPHRSLRDIVAAGGPLSPGQAAHAGLGILAALRAAHDAGVLHRDVKPGNILLDPGGRVVLTDFGIARAYDSPALTTSGILVGSPSYIAPERARGGQAGPAGDLWALGASLYTAVEGRPPFDREGALASLTAVVTDDPDPASHAGPLWPVISGLLRKDPDTRLNAAEAEQMLRRAAEAEGAAPEPEAGPGGEPGPGHAAAPEPRPPDAAAPPPDAAAPPPEPPPQAPGRPRPGRRRFRAVLAALAAGVVITGTATAIALISASSPHRQSALHAASSHRAPAHRSVPRSPAASPPSSAASAPSRPSSAAPGSGGGSSLLPAGYYRFTNSTGFSIGVPAGWQISHVGHYVYIRDPADSAIFLLIDQSDHPKPDPLADWEQQAAYRQGTYPGYHLIRLQSVRYPQAEKAADWEFTYDRNGQAVQVLNRNVLANADHAYALYWSTPQSEWAADYHFFQAFAGTFRPAGINQGG